MRRLQFSLRVILILVFGTCCYLGGMTRGMAIQQQRDKPTLVTVGCTSKDMPEGQLFGWKEKLKLPDGTEWERVNSDAAEKARQWMVLDPAQSTAR